MLVPVGDPPHRTIDPEPGSAVRLELTRRAITGLAGLEVSDVETARPGPSYSSRTLELLTERFPDQELTLLLGADAAAAIESWHRPERVVELARIGVVARSGGGVGAVEAAFERLGATDRLDLVPMADLPVSSSAVRERIARGLPIDDIVPTAVADLIAKEGLYI